MKPEKTKENIKYNTLILHNGNETDPQTGALSIPVYQTSTYHQPDIEHPGPYDYSRSGNPTRTALENTMTALEGGAGAYAFSSGMAATASVLSIFRQGDHLVATADIYGGTYRALTQLFNNFGITTTFVNTGNLDQIRRAIRPNTKALFLESPSNPLLKVTDIKGAAALAKEYGLISIMDNTFMSPYFQRPLELGVDISVHSTTKFLGGHSDVIGGIVVAASQELAAKIYFVQNCFGAVPGPWDCWLVLRGIKTLRARMEIQQQSALAIARWLREQPWVKQVYYPGLPDHAGHNLLIEQATGFGCVVSFETTTPEQAKKIMKKVKLWSVAVSLGGVESILSYPVKMSHAAIPPAKRDELGISESLLRLSIGLEEAVDLMADLALEQ